MVSRSRELNLRPSAYQPNALPPGQAGSQLPTMNERCVSSQGSKMADIAACNFHW